MSEAISIRRATFADAELIFSLIQANCDLLVPRSMGNIVETSDRFFVAEIGGEMVGCATYQIHPEIGAPLASTVELQSLAVRKDLRRGGIGRRLVEAVVEAVKAFGPRELVVLTFSPEFFKKLGFFEIAKNEIMHKLYTGCINCTKHADPYTCPEIAMKLKVG